MPSSLPPLYFPEALEELKKYSNFVVWDTQELVEDSPSLADKNKRGKPTKRPLCLGIFGLIEENFNGKRRWKSASPNDPTTWTTFGQVWKFCIANPRYRFGFVITKDCPFSCIDLDTYKVDERLREGIITAEQAQAVKVDHATIETNFNSYSELTMSGGTHIWVRGKSRKNHEPDLMELWTGKAASSDNSGNHYITLGGGPVHLDRPVRDCETVLLAFEKHYFPDCDKPEAPPQTQQPELFESFTHNEVFDNLCKSKIGDKFKELWEGRWETKYISQSEADQALMNYIWYQSKHERQSKRIFLGSALGQREKAERNDYLNGLLRKARDKDVGIPGMNPTNGFNPTVQAAWGPSPNAQPINQGVLSVTSIRDHKVKATHYLWNEWLVLETLNILAGHGGAMKSTIAYTFAATVASALNWPDGSKCETPGNVLIWSNEDSKDVIVSRCLEAGYNVDGPFEIFIIDSIQLPGNPTRDFDPAIDMAQLIDVCTQKKIKLVIIDPLVSIVAGDNHRANDVTKALAPLLKLAKESKAAILGIMHFTKAMLYERAIHSINGSAAWGNVSRCNLMVARDEKEPKGIMTRAKVNGGPIGGGYNYEAVVVKKKDDEGLEYTTIKLVFDPNMVEGSPEQILAKMKIDEPKQQRSAPKKFEAKEFLDIHLMTGPKLRQEIFDSAAKTPGAPSERTLERYYKEFGIVGRDVANKDGVVQTWWTFPWMQDKIPQSVSQFVQ